MADLPKKLKFPESIGSFLNLSQPKNFIRFSALFLMLAAIPITVQLLSNRVTFTERAAGEEYYVTIAAPSGGDQITGVVELEAAVIKATPASLAAAGNKKPVCRITAAPTSGPAPLTVRFDGSSSFDPDGDRLHYAWSLSDGYTTQEQSFSRTFNDAGEYRAFLVAADDKNTPSDLCQMTITVTAPAANQKPICRIAASPQSGRAPLAVYFDGTGSYDRDGQVVRYAWSLAGEDIGKGDASGFSHIFREAGEYRASLVVADDRGAVSDLCQVTITVAAAAANQKPLCNIAATPGSGQAPLSVRFDASSSYDPEGSIARYAWSLSDGYTTEERSFSRTFSNPGEYLASLVVSDDKNVPSDLCQVTINVTAPAANQKPVCKISAEPSSGSAPLTVRFDASGSSDADGRIVRHAWSLSDGYTTQERSFSRTFANPGEYVASLVVSDDKNAPSDLCQVKISVGQLPQNQKPICRIAAEPRSGQAPLTVQFDGSSSYDSDGQVARYAWSLSDGYTTQERSFSRTFANPGEYVASLVVSDDKNAASDLCQVTIQVAAAGENQKPICRIAASPQSGRAPLAVYFDGTGSYDRDGQVVRYAWSLAGEDIGKGDASGFSHIFREAGEYRASLVVADDRGAVSDLCQVTITVAAAAANQKPLCKIYATPTSGLSPLSVYFSGTESYDLDGSIAGYAWSLSNGYTTEARSFRYTFRKPGEYLASLVVSDDKRAPSDLCQMTITVTGQAENQKPVCNIVVTPKSGVAPLTVKLDGTASSDRDGRITRYAWNISGEYLEKWDQPSFSHTFKNTGTYRVFLVVEDDQKALSGTCQEAIVVSQKATPTARVQFWLDDKKVGEETEVPEEGIYRVAWNSAAADEGTHKLYVTLLSGGQVKATSEPVEVTVSQESPQEPVTVSLKPASESVGWVSSAEPGRNYFGDDDIYAGYFGQETYYGAVQFNLSELPENSLIKEARVILTGQTRGYVFGQGGEWRLQLLGPDTNENWASHDYGQITEAVAIGTLDPILKNADLSSGTENVFTFSNEALARLQEGVRAGGTKKISFRLEGPDPSSESPLAPLEGFDVPSNLFSWDSGYGQGGLEKPPVLEIIYFKEVPERPL